MRTTLARLAAVSLPLLLLPLGATSASAGGPDNILAAVRAADPLAIADVASVDMPEGGVNALSAHVSGVVVTVPRDPAHGILLDDGKATLRIGLPSAAAAGDARPVTSGVVSYDAHNGSTIVPIVKRDGTMQLDTVIRDVHSPSRYSYPLTVPKGQSLSLTPDGSAYVGGGGDVSAFFPEPWAKDAKGRDVPTHFEIKGNTLIQVVDLKSATGFPVVADPQFAWHFLLPSVKTTRSETKQLTGIGAGPSGVGAAAKACGVAVKFAGVVGGSLCALNIVSIMFNASKAWHAGQCARLLIGPGVIGTIPYKDSYCR